jgi:hypothetical protein
VTLGGSVNRLDVIKAVGDVITQVDVLRGSLSSASNIRRHLDLLRHDLDGRQQALTRSTIVSNTAKFQKGVAQLKEVNKTLKQTIKDVKRIEETLKALTDLVGALDLIVGARF